jgi:hypothetical protein
VILFNEVKTIQYRMFLLRMKDNKQFWCICQDLTIVNGASEVRIGENIVVGTPVWLGEVNTGDSLM